MNLFNRMKCSVLQWAEGKPPLNEEAYATIYNEFNLILYLSGLFMDLRPKYWILTAVYASIVYFSELTYAYLALKTFPLQMHDLPRAFLTGLCVVIMSNVVFGKLTVNYRRSDFVGLFRSMSENFFDYQDGEVFDDMEVEMKIFRRGKIYVLIICPTYVALTGITIVSGRYLDILVGAISADTAYDNGVYMLTPIPMWFPFRVDNNIKHYFALCFLTLAVWGIASYYVGFLAMNVVFSQSLALQFKILKFRIGKLAHFACKLYSEQTGKTQLDQNAMFNDPRFLECYNTYLNKCAAHHTILVRNFLHLQRINEWQYYLGVVTVAASLACSLLLLVIETTRISIMSFGFMTLAVGLINAAILAQQSELIIETSESISDDLYNINWADIDQRAKRTMIVMMERMKQPLILKTAVSSTPATWETYAAVLNSAYSYVNLLRALR